jgi:hypothetical protein
MYLSYGLVECPALYLMPEPWYNHFNRYIDVDHNVERTRIGAYQGLTELLDLVSKPDFTIEAFMKLIVCIKFKEPERSGTLFTQLISSG